ncbi:hypothetical protein OIU76_029652, partial [Salix suchowensis]
MISYHIRRTQRRQKHFSILQLILLVGNPIPLLEKSLYPLNYKLCPHFHFDVQDYLLHPDHLHHFLHFQIHFPPPPPPHRDHLLFHHQDCCHYQHSDCDPYPLQHNPRAMRKGTNLQPYFLHWLGVLSNPMIYLCS